MIKKAIEYYLQNVPHRGKRYSVRWLLALLPFKSLRTHYGPIFTINAKDKTNVYAFCGEYGNIIANHVKSFEAGDVFVDVGTNYGLFSLMAAKIVGDSGAVYSFEPNPHIYKYFLNNIKLNGHKNILPIHAAVGWKDSIMKLTFDEGHSGISHLAADGEVSVLALNPAKWAFLAEQLKGKRIHLKIDVEGFETEIVKILSSADWFSDVVSAVVEIDNKNLQIYNSGTEEIYRIFVEKGFVSTIPDNKKFAHYDEIFVRP